MAEDVAADRFVVIRIEGMHCHKCEEAISRSMLRTAGVHEVAVDFATGQASVLFDPRKVGTAQLTQAVREAGYKATGIMDSERSTP